MFWEENNKEIYETLKEYINITDEYPVENTHSIIRGNTNSWDSPQQLSFKAKSIFASKERQHNFRSYFTPPKLYTFSRKQLKSLEVKCADILVNKVFVPLASGNDLSHILPDTIEEKSVVLPYGFHTDWPPAANRICDLLSCPDENANQPWIRFDGCWHSFHEVCVQESYVCQICKGQLKRDITKLVQVASDAIFNPNLGDMNNEQLTDEANGHSDITVQEMDENSLQQRVEDLREIIARTNPSTPLTQSSGLQITRKENTGNKRAHCKTCGHVVQGHKRPKEAPIKCPVCPLGLCSAQGKAIKCNCEEHTPSRTPSQANTGWEFVSNTVGGITQALLNVSQGDLSEGIGSNACTVISMYTALKFFQNEINCPTKAISQQTVNSFVLYMKAGNTIYDIIDPPPLHPNLYVEEVLREINMPFEQPCNTEIIITTDKQHLKNEITLAALSPKEKNAIILIIPPDKSMLLCCNQNQTILFESHKHKDKGAIIAVTEKQNTNQIVNYLENLC